MHLSFIGCQQPTLVSTSSHCYRICANVFQTFSDPQRFANCKSWQEIERRALLRVHVSLHGLHESRNTWFQSPSSPLKGVPQMHQRVLWCKKFSFLYVSFTEILFSTSEPTRKKSRHQDSIVKVFATSEKVVEYYQPDTSFYLHSSFSLSWDDNLGERKAYNKYILYFQLLLDCSVKWGEWNQHMNAWKLSPLTPCIATITS